MPQTKLPKIETQNEQSTGDEEAWISMLADVSQTDDTSSRQAQVDTPDVDMTEPALDTTEAYAYCPLINPMHVGELQERSAAVMPVLYSLFIHAVANNLMGAVQGFLHLPLNPNADFRGSPPPLVLAAKRNCAAMVALLLQHYALPNKATHRGETALLWAGRHRNVRMMKLLVHYGAVLRNPADWEARLSSGPLAVSPQQIAEYKQIIADALRDTHRATVTAAYEQVSRRVIDTMLVPQSALPASKEEMVSEFQRVFRETAQPGVFNAYTQSRAFNEETKRQPIQANQAQPVADPRYPRVHRKKSNNAR